MHTFPVPDKDGSCVLKNDADAFQGSNARNHALGNSSFQPLRIPDREDSFSNIG